MQYFLLNILNILLKHAYKYITDVMLFYAVNYRSALQVYYLAYKQLKLSSYRAELEKVIVNKEN